MKISGVVMALIVFALLGCSKVGLGLRYFEYSAKKDVNALFQFTGEKQKKSKSAIESFIKTAKVKVLPLISERLLQFKAKPKASDFLEGVQKDFHVLQEEAFSVVDVVTEQLDHEEFQALVESYEKKLRQEEERHRDLQKSNAAIKDRFKQACEFLVGDLTAEQNEKVNGFFESEAYPFALQLKNKERNLVRLRETEGDKAVLKSLAKDYLASPQKTELAEFTASKKAYFKKLFQLADDVLQTLTPEQKGHLDEALVQLSKDLLEIAEDAA